MAAAGPAQLQFVGAADAATLTPFTIPAHQPNDFIVAIALGNAGVGTFPGVPAGWSTIVQTSGIGFGNATRIYGVRDTAGTITQISTRPSNTGSISFLVYRKTSGAGLKAFTPNTLSPVGGQTPTLGTLTAGSWIVAGIEINRNYPITGPAGLTDRAARPLSSRGLASDSDGSLTAYPGGDTFTWVGGAYYNAFAIELLLDIGP